MKLKLVFPTLEMEAEALTYRQEYFDNGEYEINGDGGLDHAENYPDWIDKIKADLTREDGRHVPSTTYFAVTDNHIVGTLQIRHKLNDFLLGYGGHIGYGVRPSERRKGYASEMLAQALDICRRSGIKKALVTCDNDNIGSARTIMKNGGILENEVPQQDGTILQRYWINLD
jgi:predicted acetyltransferase